jgi:16S rRNA (guanine1207-N2)-methyltransferase
MHRTQNRPLSYVPGDPGRCGCLVIKVNIKGIEMQLKTAEGLFSPKSIDRGTLAMLSVLELKDGDKVLDLGCGYGVVGIYAAKVIGAENVVMTDIDGMAVELAKENAALNGVGEIKVVQGDAYENVDDNDFTVILSNPPYHSDFSLPKKFIEKGFNRLRTGGKMYMVTKRKEWYKNKFISIFGGVRIYNIDGYYIFEAEKRQESYSRKKAGK